MLKDICTERKESNRIERRSIDSEERDLVNFGSEDSDLRVGGEERESTVAGRQLKGIVVDETCALSESDAEGESIVDLNRLVRARRVHVVGVAGFNEEN